VGLLNLSIEMGCHYSEVRFLALVKVAGALDGVLAVEVRFLALVKVDGTLGGI
jgi:hypothetical protein